MQTLAQSSTQSLSTPSLVDPYGRRVRKLRVSLTDQCNLRCQYCMPVDATFMDPQRYLSPEEYALIVGELLAYGVGEVRLTGGEPLLSRCFGEVLEHLTPLGIPKLSLTTNGILLDRHFENLQKAGIRHLNISLDSLDPEVYKTVTYGNQLARVLDNIQLAQSLGFCIKINMVVMGGINDQEVLAFVDYSERTRLEVRFLELMRIGYACNTQAERFIPAQTLVERIQAQYPLEPISQPLDSTSFNFTTPAGAQIGFIASESQPFCGHCSRWRLSADGILRACLLKDAGIPLRGLSATQRAEAYQELLGMKPYLRPPEVTHMMHQIGG